jgi:RNA polymerase sigma-70 factor (ECF subfamily)
MKAVENVLDNSSDSLVRAAQAGDANAFALLVDRHERMALGLAYAIVQDPDAAADVTQEAFIRAWRKIRTLDAPARFSGWLAEIVRNAATDHQRRNGRRKLHPLEELELEETRPSPADALDERETDQRLGEAIEALDELSRTAVVLRYYQGLSSRQIGELLNLTPAAVDMRLSRARAEIRRRLALDDDVRTPQRIAGD